MITSVYIICSLNNGGRNDRSPSYLDYQLKKKSESEIKFSIFYHQISLVCRHESALIRAKG